MAKYEKSFRGNFTHFVYSLETYMNQSSFSVTFEDKSDVQIGDVQVAVRVYERYSYAGQNRVSLNITVVGQKDYIFVSAITSGGSQALLFKLNTFGEENFLSTFKLFVEDYRKRDITD